MLKQLKIFAMLQTPFASLKQVYIISKELNFLEMCKTKFGSVKRSGRSLTFDLPYFYYIKLFS